MKTVPKNWLITILVLVSAIAYLLLGYAVPRQDFTSLAGLVAGLFLAYFLFLKTGISVKNGLLLAIGFRLLLLLATPALSDDFYRFLWDGRLWISGENPFLHLPAFYAENNFQGIPGLNQTLFNGLSSPQYFSVYPPICQFVFALAAFINPESNLTGIVVMRVILLLAELGSFWLMLKLLARFNLPARNVLLYALNPLVILELTGNLHFEALVIFFTLAAFHFLTLKRYHFSAVALGLAVCSKLTPLILLPFIFRRIGFKKGLIYCSVTGLTCLILFAPFITPELLAHFGSSLNLYFQKFEFNASIYYVLRGLGFYFYGYNQIAKIGILLSVTTLLLILVLALREKEAPIKTLPYRFLQALTIYYLLATIVHPWYITTLVALCIFTTSRYALVWSGLAVLSYAAYQTSAYTENPWLLLLEYAGLAAAIFYEKRYGWSPENHPNASLDLPENA